MDGNQNDLLFQLIGKLFVENCLLRSNAPISPPQPQPVAGSPDRTDSQP